ncbi:hypothetical protein GCM10007416_34600 [Kroppenstedtia guangzhouensis]|uniref:Integrase catalytic domain-containing protein n=1 Tax=Kroppenstedtia guangzhouensis TaxID=1274356 RepID=A0ABQ1H4I7_9BACL|nr:hypothetical protein GCM10007416_34600 [Kroppenstedtia guangzhouensis]
MLHREGENIHRNTVQKYMRETGLAAIYPGPNLSKRNQQHRIYPYLIRNLTVIRPNHVWGIDITYIRIPKGLMYLVAVLYWYSRYIVSWELDQALDGATLCLGSSRTDFKTSAPHNDQQRSG